MNPAYLITQAVQKLAPEMVQVANYIAAHPELAFQEFEAQRRLTSFLKRHGFHIKTGVGRIKTAFLATQHRGAGPNVGFMAEYDALPGVGHACGHHLIGPASCAAAIALSKTDFSGTITVVGCPAEEGGGGKVLLAQRGVFNKLSVAMMFHPDLRTEVVKRMLSMVEVDIEFHGKPAHAAAAPEKGINALDAAIFTYQAILGYRKTRSKDARIHGIITAGGQKPNIIPDYAALKYYIRALSMPYTRAMVKKIEAIARNEAKKLGARVKFNVNPLAYQPFSPNRALASIFREQLHFLKIKEDPGHETRMIGSSDVGNVSQKVPTIHPLMKICDNRIPHHPGFAQAAMTKRAYRTMIAAAKALALTGHELYFDKQALKHVQEEFRQRDL